MTRRCASRTPRWGSARRRSRASPCRSGRARLADCRGSPRLPPPLRRRRVEIAALEPVANPSRRGRRIRRRDARASRCLPAISTPPGRPGIPCVTLHPPLDNPGLPAEAEAQFERNCAFYARAARRARDAGTTLATHSPYGSSRLSNGICRLTKPLWGKHAFEVLFERVPDPANGMIYCFGCMYMDADDAAGRRAVFADMARFIDRIRFVHVRDVEMRPDRSFDEVLPGRGNVCGGGSDPAAVGSRISGADHAGAHPARRRRDVRGTGRHRLRRRVVQRYPRRPRGARRDGGEGVKIAVAGRANRRPSCCAESVTISNTPTLS